LQSVRREAEQEISPEQILAELRRERAIQEIKAVFERYAVDLNYFPESFASKD
jgi:hypothetical protein